MEAGKRYVFEGTLPVRVRDAAAGFDADCTLCFRAGCAAVTADKARPFGPELNEKKFKALVTSAVISGYLRLYPDGMEAEALDKAPGEALAREAFGTLACSLLLNNAVPEGFTVEEHRLKEEDEALLNGARERAALCDPEKAAEAFLKQSNAAIEEARRKAAPALIRWVCACGRENVSPFCPECGKKKSAEKWICACGSVNGSPFCPECGKKFE